MKKNEIEELKNKPAAEIEKMLRDQREHLRSLKFNLAAGKIKNFQELRAARKNIARILTITRISKNRQ